MSQNIENYLGEVKYLGGYNSALPVTSSATGSFGSLVNSGAEAVAGALTVAGAATVTGALTAVGGSNLLGAVVATGSVVVASNGFFVSTSTGPSFVYGSVTGGAVPTSPTAALGSIYINAAGTGPASRLFINTNGATAYTPITTAS